MQNQINLSPITQFIHSVRAAELGQSREVKMSIQQARLLVLALSETMDKLNQDYESLFNMLRQAQDTEVITVTIDGGDLENSK